MRYNFLKFLLICFIYIQSDETMNKCHDLWLPEQYNQNSQLQKTIANNFLEVIHKRFPYLSSNSILLDIGCGDGNVTTTIFNKYPNITIKAIDSSTNMINFANKKHKNSNLNFYIDDAQELKTIESESIDAITSFSCLHWVPNQQASFKRMFDVLKPGGWISLMFAAETGFDDPIDHAYLQITQEEPWKKFFDNFSSNANWNIALPEIIENQLKKIGFKIEYIGNQNFNYYFKDTIAFRNWVLSCFQQLKLLPNELQINCAERIVNLYLQKTLQNNKENCYYKVDSFMVIAIKN